MKLLASFPAIGGKASDNWLSDMTRYDVGVKNRITGVPTRTHNGVVPGQAKGSEGVLGGSWFCGKLGLPRHHNASCHLPKHLRLYLRSLVKPENKATKPLLSTTYVSQSTTWSGVGRHSFTWISSSNIHISSIDFCSRERLFGSWINVHTCITVHPYIPVFDTVFALYSSHIG